MNTRANQTKPPPKIILDYIQRHLWYDPHTGRIRKIKGGKLIGDTRKGKAIGSNRKDNKLRTINIVIPNKDGTKLMYNTYAHRIAWYLTYQEWPSRISHKDGNQSNNRIDNLVITKSPSLGRKGISQYHGVSWCSEGQKHWRAYIRWEGKYISIGRYQTEKEAAIAYNQWAPKYGLPLNVIVDVLEEPTPNVLAPEVAPPTEIPTQE